MTTTITPDRFARNEYRDFIGYTELAKIETNEQFKSILHELREHEWADYQFWRELAQQKKHRVYWYQILAWKFMRRVLGLTFTARYLELRERKAIALYRHYSMAVDSATKQKIDSIIEHEVYHESAMIEQIKEEKVEFISSIVLGLNDGLIELTGALVGFAFALGNNALIATSGLITGVAASLSMAASSYLQAKHEVGKDPKKAAMYTGFTYITVVMLLVFPYFTFSQRYTALIVMAVIILGIISGMSYYTAVLFDRSFKKTLQEMFIFSMGVALITFIFGSLLQRWMQTRI